LRFVRSSGGIRIHYDCGGSKVIESADFRFMVVAPHRRPGDRRPEAAR
jgi:hypothetical protein